MTLQSLFRIKCEPSHERDLGRLKSKSATFPAYCTDNSRKSYVTYCNIYFFDTWFVLSVKEFTAMSNAFRAASVTLVCEWLAHTFRRPCPNRVLRDTARHDQISD